MASYVHERYGCLSPSQPSRRGALTALARPHTVLAGGTDFYPARVGRAIDEDVLDISGIAALRGISADAAGWRLGATTTWSELFEADLPPLFDGLKQAAREVGGRQIQNAGTLAGNLCNASPAADGVPCLLALDAEVELAGPGRPRAPAARDSSSPAMRRTALGARRAGGRDPCPAPATQARSAFLKLGARRYLVISIAMAAATLEIADGRVAAARIAVGACSPVAAAPARVSRRRWPARRSTRAWPTGSRPRISRRSRRSTTCAAARPIAATPSSPCCAACCASFAS